jgi:hypothetical protein
MQILDYIEGQRSFYDNQTIETPGNPDYSQSKLIYAINRARASKYLTDNAHDDIIGEYPYDNVSKYRIRLEARATDFDPKHIEIEPKSASREDRISAMIATKALQEHMRDVDFGSFLDEYANTRPEYGGFLCKKTKDGIVRTPWENVVTDMSDIMGGVIIERHYYLPSQLKKMGWKNVDMVIETAAMKKKKQDMKQENGETTETITELIEVWELHGEVPLSMYKEAEAEYDETEYTYDPADDLEFVQCQMIVAPQGKDEKGKMQGIILQANEESESPYKYDARNPMVGRGLGEGIVEELSEHQRWHNFYKTEEARAVAIGGKVLFVTDDGNVIDSVFDAGIEHGTIMKVGEGKMFQQLNTLPTSVPLYQNIREDWNTSGDRVTSSFDTKIGEDAKNTTTYRGQYLLDENANSQFMQYREHMGRFVREVVEDWLLPEALEKAAEKDELYAMFSPSELMLIDEVLVEKYVLNEQVRVLLEEKRPVSPEEQEAMRIGAQVSLARTGNKRSIKDIKDFVKRDVLGNVYIHTTDEDRSKAVLFESYSNLLQVVDPASPEGMAIKDKIMDMLGISREQLAMYAPMTATPTSNSPKLQTEEVEAQETQAKVIPA